MEYTVVKRKNSFYTCWYGLIFKIYYLVEKVSCSTGYVAWTTVLKKKSGYNMLTHTHMYTLRLWKKYTRGW